MDDEQGVLRETLDALDLPRHGLRKWFAHNRKFCEAHGGHRVYGELLDLLERCDRALSELPPKAGRQPDGPKKAVERK